MGGKSFICQRQLFSSLSHFCSLILDPRYNLSPLENEAPVKATRVERRGRTRNKIPPGGSGWENDFIPAAFDSTSSSSSPTCLQVCRGLLLVFLLVAAALCWDGLDLYIDRSALVSKSASLLWWLEMDQIYTSLPCITLPRPESTSRVIWSCQYFIFTFRLTRTR